MPTRGETPRPGEEPADARDRIADQRDRLANRREMVADRREDTADVREEGLDDLATTSATWPASTRTRSHPKVIIGETSWTGLRTAWSGHTRR